MESVRGYGKSTMEQGRYSCSEWQNFMHSRLGEVSILIFVSGILLFEITTVSIPPPSPPMIVRPLFEQNEDNQLTISNYLQRETHQNSF